MDRPRLVVSTKNMKDILINEYNNTEILAKDYTQPAKSFIVHFVNGALCEIKGPISKKYKVVFSDNKTGHVHHVSEITNNMWTKSAIEYFVEWNIKVYELGTTIPISGAQIKLIHPLLVHEGITNGIGDESLTLYYQDGTFYNIQVGKWGFVTSCFDMQLDSSTGSIIVYLEKGYYDDFEFDFESLILEAFCLMHSTNHKKSISFFFIYTLF